MSATPFAASSIVANLIVVDTSTPYPQAVLADGPLLYYRLEELVGTRAFDSSGHGFHGTYSQNVGRQAGPGPGLGSSASFHGTNSIAVPALNATALQVTAEAWVQLNNWNNQIDVFNNFGVSGIYCGDSWELGSFQMAALNADQLQVSLWGAAGAGNGFSQRFFVPAPTFTTGPWYHIAAVYDGFGRTLTFYLNGDIVEVLNLGSAPPVNLTSAHIGAWLGFDQNFYRFMDGQIDEVAIYATALPPERIAAHY